MSKLSVNAGFIMFPHGVTIFAEKASLYPLMVFLRNEQGTTVADIELDALGVTSDELFSAMTNAGFQVDDKRG